MIAKKVGKMNIKNGFGLYSNPSCLIFWICVWVYGVMDTLPPHLLISSKSDFSIFRKSMINSKEFLLLSWDLEAMFSLIYGPSISWLMCGPPFYILLQLLCSLFVLIFSVILSPCHSNTSVCSNWNFNPALLLLFPWMKLWKPYHTDLMYRLYLCL